MIDKFEMREIRAKDIASVETLYRDAFPVEDLLPLVRELLSEPAMALSLVGLADRALAGHVIFTACGIAGRSAEVALLGPLAVAPGRQRQGIGAALVREGLRRLKNDGVSQVYVLGDPEYYRRFGFQPEGRVTPPYPLPEEWNGAWQSVCLHGIAPPLPSVLSLPPPWMRPALWAP